MNKAKEYFEQVKICDTHINNMISDLKHLNEMVTKITSSIKPDVVSGGGNHDKVGEFVSAIVDLQEEINRKIDQYVDMKRDINKMLEQMKDADQISVLYKRYFEYKTWEQIAYEMNMSFRNVCYIHGKALQVANDLMKEES